MVAFFTLSLLKVHLKREKLSVRLVLCYPIMKQIWKYEMCQQLVQRGQVPSVTSFAQIILREEVSWQERHGDGAMRISEKSHISSPAVCEALQDKLLSAEGEYSRDSSYQADVIRKPQGRWGGSWP